MGGGVVQCEVEYGAKMRSFCRASPILKASPAIFGSKIVKR